MEFLDGFTAIQIVIVAATALAAGFVRGLAGFGLSVVLVPVLQLWIAPSAAVLVGIICLFLIGLSDIGRIRKDADRSALPIILIALVCMPLGLWALVTLPAAWARLLIALVSLGAFVLVVVPLGQVTLSRRPAIIVSGIFTGFFGGFAGMPGPGMAPFYLRGRLNPAAARASLMAVFVVVSPLSAVFFIVLGVGGLQEVATAAMLLPLIWFGDWLGHRAYGRVTTRQWQVCTALVLGIAAAAALAKLL